MPGNQDSVNQAKIREALRQVSRVAVEMTRKTVTGESEDRKTVDDWALRLCDIVSSTLAAPPLSCDRCETAECGCTPRKRSSRKTQNYELTDETRVVSGHTLHRIRALRDLHMHGVKTGDLGGWIESDDNLTNGAWVSGNAHVYGNAQVYGNAHVCGDACVCDNACVHGKALVCGNACVCDNACVYDNAIVCGDAWVCGDACICGDATVMHGSDYFVAKNTWSSFRWFTYTRSNKMWKVGCFYGTGYKLIAKAYKDSELSGKCYEAVVREQEAIYKAIEDAKGEMK